MLTDHLKIDGMTCGHCVMTVKKFLSANPNVNVLDVQIGSATVEYDEHLVTKESLAEALDIAGYKLVPQ
jgi:copper chaperone